MACLPPSTGSVTPVMNDAASDAKNAMALATSMASPGRPRACVLFECSRKRWYSVLSIPLRRCNSVIVTPGLNKLNKKRSVKM